MKELRCGFCNKLLAKIEAKTAIVEIKCKCGKLNTFEESEEKKNKKNSTEGRQK